MGQKRHIKQLMTYGAMAAGLAAYLYWQNYRIKTTRYYVTSPVYANGLEGVTIAQISDLHYPNQRVDLDDLVNQVAAIQPDIIVFTGDNIAKQTQDFDQNLFFAFASALRTIAPVYAVSGENDLASPLSRQAEHLLMQAGVVFLNDQAVTVTVADQEICLIGLAEKLSRRFLLGDALRYVHLTKDQEKQVKLLLAHHPEAFLRYHENIQKSPDLVLTGHAHGGEVRIPGIGGIKAKNQGFLPKYTEGVFHIPGNPDKKMVVSRGIGQGDWPLRLNNQAELLAVTLTSTIDEEG